MNASRGLLAEDTAGVAQGRQRSGLTPMSEGPAKRPAKMTKSTKAAIFLLSLGESDLPQGLSQAMAQGSSRVWQRHGAVCAPVHREQAAAVG